MKRYHFTDSLHTVFAASCGFSVHIAGPGQREGNLKPDLAPKHTPCHFPLQHDRNPNSIIPRSARPLQALDLCRCETST